MPAAHVPTLKPGDPFKVAMLLFPNLTQLDLTGPHEVFKRVRGVEVITVWKDLRPVRSATGLTLDVTNAASCAGLAWSIDGEAFDTVWLAAGVERAFHHVAGDGELFVGRRDEELAATVRRRDIADRVAIVDARVAIEIVVEVRAM